MFEINYVAGQSQSPISISNFTKITSTTNISFGQFTDLLVIRPSSSAYNISFYDGDFPSQTSVSISALPTLPIYYALIPNSGTTLLFLSNDDPDSYVFRLEDYATSNVNIQPVTILIPKSKFSIPNLPN